MTMPSLIWGSPQWITSVLVLMGVVTAVILWSYARARSSRSVRIAAATLKVAGIAFLAASLLDPLLSGTRPLRGANAFAILADNSQSLGIKDDHASGTRGEWLQNALRRSRPGAPGWDKILTSAVMSSIRTFEASTDSRA